MNLFLVTKYTIFYSEWSNESPTVYEIKRLG